MAGAYPLIRDVAALKSLRPEVLVIGGGIYGAWIACDAAQRGLRTALIERDDWAAGTSSASSKLIHGGLRYLEHFEFGLVRHALAERRTLTRIAPHLVRPLRFNVPVWKGARAGRLKLTAGLVLYDLLAGSDQPVARHGQHSSKALMASYPALQSEGLRGGLSYGDCQEDDARMTLAVVAAAQQAGAVVCNRVTAEALLEDEFGGVKGARVCDRVSGEAFDVPANCVVNAAGPWAAPLVGERAPTVKLIKGSHVVMPAIPGCNEAFLLMSPQDGRVFFVIPWYGRTLVGTTESEVTSPAEGTVTDADIDYLLSSVNQFMPGLGWTRADVVGRFCGVRSLQAEEAGSLSAVSREFVILSPRAGLVMPLGGKYTTARYDAGQVVDTVYAVLNRPVPASRSGEIPLPGTPEGAFTPWLDATVGRLTGFGVDAESARQAALRHGTQCEALAEFLSQDATLAQRIDPAVPFVRAEIKLIARDEMVDDLRGLLRRRIPLLLLSRPTREMLTDVATLAAPWLGWDAATAARQVETLLADESVAAA